LSAMHHKRSTRCWRPTTTSFWWTASYREWMVTKPLWNYDGAKVPIATRR